MLHSLPLQADNGGVKLVSRIDGEAADAYIAYAGTYDIGGIDGVKGYLVSDDAKFEYLRHAPSHDAQIGNRALGTPQELHHLVARHLHACDGRVIDADDTVSRQDAHFLRRTFAHRLYDDKRVLENIKLDADAFKSAAERLIKLLGLLGISVARVRIEFRQHTAYSRICQFIFIERIDIERLESHLRHIEFAQGHLHGG